MAVGSLRDLIAADLRSLINDEAGDFPAQAVLFAVLTTRGKVLARGPGFTWGMVPPLVCEACDGVAASARWAGVGLECLIAAVDVLDDIEDDDAADAPWQPYGIPTAINVATLLLFLVDRAIERLARDGVTLTVIQAATQTMARAGVAACIGQQHDLEPTLRRAINESAYFAICERKAGAFVEAGCRIGACVAGASAEVVAAMGSFGRHLGVAMQLGNDIEAVIDPEVKRGDVPAAKRTLPLLFALESGPEPVRLELREIVDRIDAGAKRAGDAARLQELIRIAGGVDYCQTMLDVVWERAVATLVPVLGESQSRRLIDLLHQP